MHIETIAPFHIAISHTLTQISVREDPGCRGHHNSDQNEIHNHNVEYAVDCMAERQVQRVRECSG